MTELSGGGASNAPSASNAMQAAGGTSSQNNAVANSGMTPEQQKAVDDFNNYKKYQYKEKNSDRATIDNLEKSGQISKETASEYRGYVDKGADIGFTETEMKVISAPAQRGSELNADGTFRVASNNSEISKAFVGRSITLNDVVKNESGNTIISESDPMHPLESNQPSYELSGSAKIYQDSLKNQEKSRANGDYLDAYKDDVLTRKVLSNIQQSQGGTINPNDPFKVNTRELLRTDPLIGNAFTFAETTLFTAEGEFSPLPLVGNENDLKEAYSERLAGYEKAEGGNTGRIEQSMSGAIDVATLPLNFIGATGTGTVIGVAGKGLAKLSGTRAGAAVSNIFTKPWISNEVLGKTTDLASTGLRNAANSGIKLMNKLPATVSAGITLAGSQFTPLRITSAVAGLSAKSVGLDVGATGFAKTGIDFTLGEISRHTLNPTFQKAYQFYTNPLISAANARGLASAIKSADTKILVTEAKAASKFPKAFKAATALKNAVSTPGAVIMNTAQLAYFADAGYRIATSDDKLKTAGQIAIEIPAAFVGAKYGMKAVDKVSDYLATRGRTFVPIEKIGYAEGIPLGKGMTDSSLEKSFALNTPIPRPYMFGRTNYQNQPTPKQASLPSSNPYNPKYGYKIDEKFPDQVWHATPQGERLGKRIVVGDSTSELPGIYTSEVGVGYYLHLEQKSNFKPALLITESKPSFTPKFATFRIRGTERIPVNGRYAQAEFLRENASPTKAYAPNMKEEYEALLPPGANFKRTGKGYYTVINGNRVAIDEYAPDIDATKNYLEFRIAKKTSENPKIKNISTDELISASKKEFKKKYGEDLRVYKQASNTSSYSRSSGRQIPIGSSSYGGSKASRSLSKYGGSSPASSGFSDFSLSSFGKPSSRSSPSGSKGLSSPRGLNSPSASSPAKFASAISGSSRASAKAIQSPYQSKKITAPLNKKRDNKIKLDVDYYKAAQRGRIDHLSIVDPLEMLGKGSLTNRNRADMTLYKQQIYLVDNAISMKKPSKRFKI